MNVFALRPCAIAVLFCGCFAAVGPETGPSTDKWRNTALADVTISAEERATIEGLVDQLVLAEGQATNQPMRNPSMKIYGADGTEVKPAGDPKKAEEYQRRFVACQTAFRKLADFGIAAFPILVAHLDDNRQSINFRNHFLGNSVGDACRWNIYFQLMDRPKDYSSYGYDRKGRDGQRHPKPYWQATPFDDAASVRRWLDQNKSLTYLGMQIKCLQWLLEKEKAIGACDPDSYFVNILPLEIRILERRQQTGEDVARELTELRKVMEKKDASRIPPELLPAK